MKKEVFLRKMIFKKILIPTVARSDFGIMKNIIKTFYNDKFIETKLLVVGSHFSKIFGSTVSEIKNEGIINFHKISYDIKKSKFDRTLLYISDLMRKLNNYLKTRKYDYCIILGDRYEMLAIAIACKLFKIKIIHFCGGSITKGALDEYYRNCITKLSDYHFVETKYHYNNLIKYNGVERKNIFLYGAPALENIKSLSFLDKNSLIKKINLKKFNNKIAIFTYHSETTLSKKENINQLNEILSFLKIIIKQFNYKIIVTSPNADSYYEQIIQLKINFCKENSNAVYISHLGINNYYNLMKISDVMIGNSSSGIIEAKTFNLPVLNCGNRQFGRYCSNNVITSEIKLKKLIKNFSLLTSVKYKKKIKRSKNLYELKMNSKLFLKFIKKI